jgi:hypothetical protein
MGTQRALGRHRVALHVVPVPCQHATEILGPRAVHCTVDDHVTDMPSAQILWLGREPQKRIDLALHEQLDRL